MHSLVRLPIAYHGSRWTFVIIPALFPSDRFKNLQETTYFIPVADFDVYVFGGRWECFYSVATVYGLLKNLEEGLRWFEQAEADFKTARDCLEDGNYYATAFFSQQSAEKALKGFLYSKGYRALITHSVTELLEEASKHHDFFKQLREQGLELDRHYIGSRYPNFYPKGPAYKYYSQEIAARCLSYAELILSAVGKLLKG